LIRGFILAGGRSSRFGEDKARFPVDGVPMLQRVMAAMIAAGHTPRIIARDDRLADMAPVLVEPTDAPRHPLNGVLAGLASLAPDESALFAPCDLPWIPPEAFTRLLAAGPAAAAHDGERAHPLVALYPASWRQRVADTLARGGSVRSVAADAVSVQMPADWLKNVNRRSDLRY